VAYVHNIAPEIDIAVKFQQKWNVRKNEMRQMFMSFLNV
jgi:hypothetical protein